MERYIVGCDPENVPYTMCRNGEWSGSEFAFANAVFSQAQLTVQVVPVPWTEFFSALRIGYVDAVFSSISATDARRREFLFSTPYFDSPEVFFGRTSINVEDIAAGRVRVGVLKGSNHEQYITELFPGAAVTKASSMPDLARMLKREQVDAVLMELNGALHWFPAASGYGKIGTPIVDRKFFGEGSAFAVRPGRNDLLEALNSAIAVVCCDRQFYAY